MNTTAQTRRKFLVVVDDTPECRVALRFASARARNTGGGVMMLRVIEPAEFEHWAAVRNLMREEAREEAEALLQGLATEVNGWAGVLPEIATREGRARDEILKLLEEDPGIRILVLGASPEGDNPGPLVTDLAGRLAGSMRVPVTVVPGNMTSQQIDEVT